MTSQFETRKPPQNHQRQPASPAARTNPDTSGAPPGYVPLPAAPKTRSPVPWLTSIHATPGRGNYGDARYRGNCSGLLVRDLLQYFRPRRAFDPMSGGGTFPDVCEELGVPCVSKDVRRGFDASDPGGFSGLGRFDFVWLHPPYWRMIRWSDDPRCLANAPTLDAFLGRLRAVFRNCRNVLWPSGVLAVLMGDHRYEGRYLGLPFRTFAAAEAEGFELAAPEIVRFSHGTTSAAEKEYPVSIIPRVHDVCMVFRPQAGGRGS
ncbi:MAG: hypothetical protein U0797_00520 [Gemmataceae bacterium]